MKTTEQLSPEEKAAKAAERKADREAKKAADEAKWLREEKRQFAEDTKDWNVRILDLVIHFDSVRRVDDKMIFVNKYDDNRILKIIPETNDDVWVMQSLEQEVKEHFENIKEQERLIQVREDALAMLSDEQKSVLGLL